MRMLTYSLEGRKKCPLYEYLYDCIKEDIITGKIKAGETLPSKRALARHMNLALNTVTNAYELLAAEGYIIPAQRKGYFVQDVSDFVKQNIQEEVPEVEEAEHEFFCDFKSNRQGIEHFPISIWSRCMRQTTEKERYDLLTTVPYNGLQDLRVEIARELKDNRNMVVSPGNIIIGAGTEYLYGRILQLFGKNAVIAMEDPGYKKFATISRAYGNEAHFVPIDESGLRVDKLRESGANIVHVSPANHFPTGISMPLARRSELLVWASGASDRYIIEDDYDSEFRFSGKPMTPLFASDIDHKVIYINTFSKTLVPSLRISFMVLPTELMRKYVDTMSFYSCTVSSFEQYALARFMRDGYFTRHLNRMKKRLKEQHDVIVHELKASPLIRVAEIIEHNAGTHFLLKVHTTLTDDEVRARAVEQNLNVAFYSEYSMFPTSGDCVLVINYAGLDVGKIPEVVERLCKVFLEL